VAITISAIIIALSTIYNQFWFENDVQAQQTQQANNHIDLMRGHREGNTYINDLLGLRFTMPTGWDAATDEDIGRISEMANDVLNQEVGSDINMLTDIFAINPITGANVQVIFERLQFPNSNLSEAQYIELTAADENFAAIGGRVYTDIEGTTRIGNYNWYSFRTVLDFDRITYGRQFINIQNGYARIIIITYFEDSESPNEILAMFN